MRTNGVEKLPLGLRIKVKSMKLDKPSLDSAVECANLNVTERVALNDKFFPKGNGVNIFPLNKDTAEFTYYYKKDVDESFKDEFSEKVSQIKLPDDMCYKHESVRKSDKDSFQTNLDNAIIKLKRLFRC